MQIPHTNINQENHSFHIRPILRQVDPVAMNEPPHRHNYQELIWIRSGSGVHKIDQTVLEIKPHTFYLIIQGQIHYFMQGIDLDGYVIRFTDDFLLNSFGAGSWDYRMTLFNHFAVHQSLSIQAEETAVYQQHLTQMWQEQESSTFGTMPMLRHLLSILLIRLERTHRHATAQQKPLSTHAEIYGSFLTALDQNFRQQTTVSHYASQLHITPRQLSDIVAQLAGKTAKKLIQERRIIEAKRLLRHSNASIKEISYALSFHDSSYFSKLFKHAVGVSPRKYKSIS